MTSKRTHLNRHIAQTPTDMLDRVLAQKTSQTTFPDKQTANVLIEKAVKQNSKIIENWIVNTTKKKHEITVTMTQNTGTGILCATYQKNNLVNHPCLQQELR